MTITSAIQPIETTYAGCRFRSRLEARWGVFFDALSIAWRYEPQGFELPSGAAYLPDFHLPDLDLWVEVKGAEEEFCRDGARYAEAALTLGGNGLLILGSVPDTRLGKPQHFVLTPEEHCCGETILCLHIAWDEMLHNASAVKEIGFPCTTLMSHRSGALPALKGYNRGRAEYTDPGPVAALDWPAYEPGTKAYIAARSARFEHGERG
jgi:hypothetical protein